MTGLDAAGLGLVFLPFAALAAAYPRRSGAALTLLGVGLAGGAALLAAAPAEKRLFFGIWWAWSVLGCFAAWALVSRDQKEYELRSRALLEKRTRAEELTRDLGERKARGIRIEREHKETVVLYGMIKSLSEALGWDDVKPRLASAVEQYLGLSDFVLYAADIRSQDQLRLLVSRRMEGSPGASWPTLERALAEQGSNVKEPRLFQKPEPAVGVPIQDNGEVLGYFYCRVPIQADAEALFAKTQMFAQEVSFAFRRLKIFQEVESLSQIDGLTGVYRRGEFEDRLNQEVVRAKTFKTTFGLMILDIDHFKHLNDRYGHPFGDQVLRRIGEILIASVYDTDFVARYGGEEFTIILPRAESEGILRKAETIRRAVEGERFALGFETVPVTISIGLAHFPSDAARSEDLVRRADQALYQAKSLGRNRVVDARGMRDPRV